MTETPDSRRHSRALTPTLLSDPIEIANCEARNALCQFDAAQQLIDTHLDPERPFRLRPSTILTLHRYALDGLSAFAGNYRPAGVEIHGSKHSPVGAHVVPELIEALCDYVNDNWQTSTAIHLAAYVLWRLNWIHPFDDGNGRTARMVSYVVLCIRLGYRLPGTRTIPEQIAADKRPYYEALEAADRAEINGVTDVDQLEVLLGDLLAKQLIGVVEDATGQPIA